MALTTPLNGEHLYHRATNMAIILSEMIWTKKKGEMKGLCMDDGLACRTCRGSSFIALGPITLHCIWLYKCLVIMLHTVYVEKSTDTRFNLSGMSRLSSENYRSFIFPDCNLMNCSLVYQILSIYLLFGKY